VEKLAVKEFLGYGSTTVTGALLSILYEYK